MTDVSKLRRQFAGQLVMERIRVFYARMNAELRDLEKYKRKNGVCTAGISCMRPVEKGSSCAHHAAARKAGLKLRSWKAYTTEYGLIRKEVEREKREAKKHPKPKTRAA